MVRRGPLAAARDHPRSTLQDWAFVDNQDDFEIPVPTCAFMPSPSARRAHPTLNDGEPDEGVV